MSTYLSLRWTKSRGRETYGYNVVTLTDESTGKRFRAMGGGYDMTGTVFGEWLADAHADALTELADRLGWEGDGPRQQLAGHYGAFRYKGGPVILDGACGIETMTRLARAAGLELERTYVHTGRNRGETTGWVVTSPGE